MKKKSFKQILWNPKLWSVQNLSKFFQKSNSSPCSFCLHHNPSAGGQSGDSISCSKDVILSIRHPQFAAQNQVILDPFFRFYLPLLGQIRYRLNNRFCCYFFLILCQINIWIYVIVSSFLFPIPLFSFGWKGYMFEYV